MPTHSPNASKTLLMAIFAMTGVGCGSGDPQGDTNQSTSNAPPQVVGELAATCTDTQYSEPAPSLQDVSQHIKGYDSSQTRAFYKGVLSERYPMGAKLLSRMETTRIDCVETFKGQASSYNQALQQIATVVHECGHFYNLDQSNATINHYAVTPTLSFNCRAGDAIQRGGRTIARSRLLEDAFVSHRPACHNRPGCDIYAEVYFQGDPENDDISESGDQGYNMLLEEMLQYINSLATSYAVRDIHSVHQIDRDAVLTFLWYIERYLQLTRQSYPESYTFITQDDCWRKLTLTLWARAWFYLELSRDTPSLGLHDEAIEALVMEPSLLNEIRILRKIDGCQIP